MWQATGTQWLDSFCKRMLNKIGCNGSPTGFLPSFMPSSRCEFHLFVHAYKILKGLCPGYLTDTIRYASTVTTRSNRRNEFQAFVPQVRINMGRLATYFRSILAWNRLPKDLTVAKDLTRFKRMYKSIIFGF